MEEFFKIITEKLGEEASALVKSEFPKFAVPKEQYNKKVDELSTAGTELSGLKKISEEVEALRAKATEADQLKATLEATKGEYEKRLGDTSKRGSLNIELLKAKANPDALDYLGSQLKLDEIEPDKFGEHIERLRTEKPSFFATTTASTPRPEAGRTPDPQGDVWSKIENVFKTK